MPTKVFTMDLHDVEAAILLKFIKDFPVFEKKSEFKLVSIDKDGNVYLSPLKDYHGQGTYKMSGLAKLFVEGPDSSIYTKDFKFDVVVIITDNDGKTEIEFEHPIRFRVK